MAYFLEVDHCTRCHRGFQPGETRLMVREKVGVQWLIEDGCAVACIVHDVQWVPVCDGCTTPREHEGLAVGTEPCIGCGEPLR